MDNPMIDLLVLACIVSGVVAYFRSRRAKIKQKEKQLAALRANSISAQKALDKKHQLDLERMLAKQQEHAHLETTHRPIESSDWATGFRAEVSEKIELLKIPQLLAPLRKSTGKVEVEDKFEGGFVDVDLDEQTCSCARFLGGKYRFPKNHMGRICAHIYVEMEKQDAFSALHHIAKTALLLSLREETKAAYALQHSDLPTMYVVVGKDENWINFYSRTKVGKQTVQEASGEFERFGWNCKEKRWSYGMSSAGSNLLRDFLKQIDKPEDFELVATPLISEQERDRKLLKLSERSDPRKNPDKTASQYGPEQDAYEIPDGLLTKAIPLRISLTFRYMDKKKQESRRTVNLKEIQFYGREGEYIYGECLMRHAGRTFKTSRMWDVTDTTTGEVVENVTEYLKASYEESALGRLEDWFTEYERIAKGWLYLLKANKKPGKKEYDVLKYAFSKVLNGQVVTTRDIQDLFEGYSPATPVGFQRLVGGIKKHHPTEALFFASVCRKLVAARKNPNFADQAALNYVLGKIDTGAGDSMNA